MGGFPRFKMRADQGPMVGGPKVGPTMKRGKSVQAVGTPPLFIAAVERTWGVRMGWDLAADETNAKGVSRYQYFGPGSRFGVDSLAQDWAYLSNRYDTYLWLNPPFDNIGPWVRKCAEESGKGALIFLLSRASLDSDWWVEEVAPYAVSYTLKPRLIFEGQTEPYPFPLAISLFGIEDRVPGLAGRWEWETGIFRRFGDGGVVNNGCR